MALLRHGGIYFLARILSGAAAFVLIAAYTRLLSAQEFGELALALAGVGFFSVPIVDGLMLALLRFQPSQPQAARATMLVEMAEREIVVLRIFVQQIGKVCTRRRRFR